LRRLRYSSARPFPLRQVLSHCVAISAVNRCSNRSFYGPGLLVCSEPRLYFHARYNEPDAIRLEFTIRNDLSSTKAFDFSSHDHYCWPTIQLH
jgi:hypothetical protein